MLVSSKSSGPASTIATREHVPHTTSLPNLSSSNLLNANALRAQAATLAALVRSSSLLLVLFDPSNAVIDETNTRL